MAELLSKNTDNISKSNIQTRTNGPFHVCNCLASKWAKVFGLTDQNNTLVKCNQTETCNFKIPASDKNNLVFCQQTMNSMGGEIGTREILSMQNLPVSEKDKIERILTYDSYLNPSTYNIHISLSYIKGNGESGVGQKDIRNERLHLKQE